MLISKEVIVKWNKKNKKYYENKGYNFTKYDDEFKVKIEDLSKGSKVKIQVQCDNPNCENPIKFISWFDYKRAIDRNNKYYCKKCALKLYGKKKELQTRIKRSCSFGYWLIKNLLLRQAVSIIACWDEKKNNCDIREITKSSSGINGKGYWFKCSKGIHSSELKSICAFTNNFKKYKKTDSLQCKACNSLAQWGISKYGNDFLEKYWDYEKNNKLGLNPWKISKTSNKKIWIKCQKHEYHGSYFLRCNHFIENIRCPFCVNRKIHPKDSLGQYIIDNYGKEFLDKIWSDKNKKSAFEYAPNAHQEIWWKCPNCGHEDFKRSIEVSNVCNFRCPKCSQKNSESMLQEKTRLYLESLGYNILHENKCTLVPINPRTKYPMPFDNEIKELHLVIEVMGIQHYQEMHKNSSWLNDKTPKEYLHQRRLYDRYKRIYAKARKYKYLAIPYWIDDKNETWKKLINNKINKILEESEVN